MLDENSAIIIYPENSTLGYMDPPTSFHSGFVKLCQLYYKKRGEDLPLYVCYCNGKKHRIVVAEPMYVNKMLQEGKTETEIAEIAAETCAKLHDKVLDGSCDSFNQINAESKK